jgi:hypothetical protein
MLKHLKEIVVEIATLQRPVTATAIAGVVVVIVKPFGLHLTSEEVAVILAGVGTVAAAVEKILAAK